MPMPIEIVGLGKDSVTLQWDEEESDVWPARALRLACTCAGCKSEITGERLLEDSTIPEDITVIHMDLVGNYGVNVHFSDGHTTGIYRFERLRGGPASQ